MPPPPRELITAADAAKILGVSRRRVLQLFATRPDFPRPYAVTRGSKQMNLWRADDIERWANVADRSPGGGGR